MKAASLFGLIGIHSTARVVTRSLRTGLTCALAVASHPVLDSFTNGGLGCAFFWPFDLTRYFAPWNPIPFAPTGQPLFSPAWLRVIITESVLFAPVIGFALWPRARDRSQPVR